MTGEQQESVRRAVEGDKEALCALLERYGPQVEAGLHISATWRGQLDAADVMQVTYLEAFGEIRRFDPQRAAAFPAWLRRMAENNLRDAIRALEAKKHPSPRHQLDAHGAGLALLDVLTAGVGTPSRALRVEEACGRLREALRCLPPDYARVVQLYDLEAQPIELVAQALQRSAGAIYMLRARAHDRLRELLGGASQILETRT